MFSKARCVIQGCSNNAWIKAVGQAIVSVSELIAAIRVPCEATTTDNLVHVRVGVVEARIQETAGFTCTETTFCTIDDTCAFVAILEKEPIHLVKRSLVTSRGIGLRVMLASEQETFCTGYGSEISPWWYCPQSTYGSSSTSLVSGHKEQESSPFDSMHHL